MARLRGVFRFQGKMGDVVADKNGVLRPAPESNKAQVATDPAFARTRENNAEFAQAAVAGKLVRQALNKPLRGNGGSQLVARLQGQLRRLVNLDTTHPRGQRRVTKANIGKLVGFNFNALAPLEHEFTAAYGVVLTGAGEVQLTIPQLVSLTDLPELVGPTHYELEMGVVVLDFEQNTKRIVAVAGIPAPALLDATPVMDLKLTANLGHAPGASESVLVVLGVNFLEEVNGVLYPLKNGAHNPLAVVWAG